MNRWGVWRATTFESLTLPEKCGKWSDLGFLLLGLAIILGNFIFASNVWERKPTDRSCWCNGPWMIRGSRLFSTNMHIHYLCNNSAICRCHWDGLTCSQLCSALFTPTVAITTWMMISVTQALKAFLLIMTEKTSRWSLKLLDLTEGDFGNYSCTANNRLGLSRAYNQLNGRYTNYTYIPYSLTLLVIL